MHSGTAPFRIEIESNPYLRNVIFIQSCQFKSLLTFVYLIEAPFRSLQCRLKLNQFICLRSISSMTHCRAKYQSVLNSIYCHFVLFIKANLEKVTCVNNGGRWPITIHCFKTKAYKNCSML